MARPADPERQYRVSVHATRGYRYASTQPCTIDPETGKKKYSRVHWGTVDENGRFIPGARYLLAAPEERGRLIFPPDWDLGEARKYLTGLASATGAAAEPAGKPSSSADQNSAGPNDGARAEKTEPEDREKKAEKDEKDGNPPRVCIVTGLSGSGKSTAMHVFEDMRYFTVDGLPVSMAPEMAALMRRPSMSHFKGMVLGLDMRQMTFLNEIEDALEKIRAQGCRLQTIFLEADVQAIMRRYAATRRPHPLEHSGLSLEEAALRERSRMARLRSLSDMVVDTTRLSVHDLSRILQKRFRDEEGHLRALRVFVLSFGFKHGIPSDAEFVFDLRFLPNPYFVSELRAGCGLDQEVADYVFATPRSREFLTRIKDLLFFILPQMEAEGRYRVVIAFGCTGGHHRSVAVAEAVGRNLKQSGWPVTIEHRHLALETPGKDQADAGSACSSAPILP